VNPPPIQPTVVIPEVLPPTARIPPPDRPPPSGSIPAGRLAKILDDKTGPDWFAPWAWCSRALCAYRSGDAESAMKFVKKSEELKPAEVAHASNLAILALAEHQLQHPDEACRALDDARQAIQLLQADPSKRDHDLLIAEILFHEAEALIASNKP